MENKNLFKEAIADAKAVREAALANAKAALEEALTPKLQSMLAAKLNEMEYEEEEELEEMSKKEDEMEEGFLSSHGTDDEGENLDFNLEETEELEEEFDLSEILAELNDDESLEEAKKEEKDEKKKKKMMKEGEEEEEEEKEEEETEEVADMTIDDLKALIADIVAQEMGEKGGEEGEEDTSMDMGGEETSSGDEDEINLDELLAELDSLNETDDKEDKMEENIFKKIGQGLKSASTKMGAYIAGADPELYKQCKEEGKSIDKMVTYDGKRMTEMEACIAAKGGKVTAQSYRGAPGFVGNLEEKEEMKEAIATINTLRAELNEVNLLNAKLLYVNKIFKAKNLSESQKLQVIASFDKATTAKEAKVVYESLNATLTATAPKKQIKESLGFASKAAGVAPKSVIVESNDVISRMQKLANIIK